MTDQSHITPHWANETPRHTPKSLAFPSLLACVANMIFAERDLEDINFSQDPAFSNWMRDAELSQERLSDSLRGFHDLPNEAPEDRPLQRMALVIDAMLSQIAPEGARRLHRQMQMAFFIKFQVPGIESTAMHRNGMLIQARHLVSALAALPLFDSTSDLGRDDEPDEGQNVSTL